MNPLTPHEAEEIAAWKRSPNDFDCLPLDQQSVSLARYLIARGDTLFSADDVALLFAHADMVSPRDGKPIRPTSEVIAKHIDRAIQEGKLDLLPGDAPGVWRATAPDYVLEVSFELKANDRIQAKDQVLRLPIVWERRVVSDEVEGAGDVWRVSLVLHMRTSGMVAVRSELLTALRTLGTRWEIRLHADGGLEGETSKLSVSRMGNCRFRMRKQDAQ